MKQRYTIYKVTKKDSGEYYIGYTKHQIGIDYFTSSEHITFSKDTLHEWNIEIIKQDDDRDRAWRIEQALIKEHIEDDLCLNRSYQDPNGKVWGTKWDDPEWRVMMTNAISESRKDPKLREQLRKTTTAAWARPESRARFMAGLRAANDKESNRQNKSKAVKKFYEDPANRQKQSKIQRRAWSNPELIARHSAMIKQRMSIQASCLLCRRTLSANNLSKHYGSNRCRK